MVLRSGIMGAAGAGRAGDGTGTPGRWDPRDPPAPQGHWDTGAVTRRTPFGGSETCSHTPWTGVTGANWTCSCWCSRGGCPENPPSAAPKTHSVLSQKLTQHSPKTSLSAPPKTHSPPEKVGGCPRMSMAAPMVGGAHCEGGGSCPRPLWVGPTEKQGRGRGGCLRLEELEQPPHLERVKLPPPGSADTWSPLTPIPPIPHSQPRTSPPPRPCSPSQTQPRSHWSPRGTGVPPAWQLHPGWGPSEDGDGGSWCPMSR